jgi:hypothetical protein
MKEGIKRKSVEFEESLNILETNDEGEAILLCFHHHWKNVKQASKAEETWTCTMKRKAM